jgi:adenylate cyclase
VTPGQGVIGQAAEKRRMMKMAGVRAEMRYGRAIRKRAHEVGAHGELGPEIPLPGLPDAQVQVALPLMLCTKLVGVLAVESQDPLFFDEWDEAFLQIVANQIALGVDRMQKIDEAADGGAKPAAKARKGAARTAESARQRSFVYYKNDECVFVDGEYLIRNIPGKILWKMLKKRIDEGQTEFTNRELRLDPTLGLPPIKDNLESRLILLKKRLAEKCPDVRIVPVKRGRFALEMDADIELVERDQA